jgi:hypothetical protein
MYAVLMPSLGNYMRKFNTRILATCLPAASSVVMAKKKEIKFTRGGFVYQEQKYDVRKQTIRYVSRKQSVQQ